MEELCINCNKNKRRKSRKLCDRCSRSPEKLKVKNKVKSDKSRLRRMPWKAYKKDHCESPECLWHGPLIASQLQVDHIDGDKNNNDPSNFMTLCANCHALKTWINKEYLSPSLRGDKNVVVQVMLRDCTSSD